jgi:hypothetical protein
MTGANRPRQQNYQPSMSLTVRKQDRSTCWECWSVCSIFFECPFRQHSPRASHSICKFGRGRDIAGALSAKKDGVRATCFLIPTDHASCNSDCCWVLSWSVCLRTPWTGNIVKEPMHLQGSLRFFVCGTCDDSWNSWRVMIVPICQ